MSSVINDDGADPHTESAPFSVRHPDLAAFLERCGEVEHEQLANQRGRRSSEESRAIEEHVVAELQLEPGHNLLENGCGTGLLARACAPHVRRLVAMDISAGLLRRARANLAALANVSLLRADSVRLPFAAQSFDRILFFSVIPYCSREELLANLLEMKRVCRAGGTILIGDISDPGRELTMIVFHGGWGAPSGLLKYVIRRLTGAVRRGWYRPADFAKIAASVGLRAQMIQQRPGMAFRHWRCDCRLTVPAEAGGRDVNVPGAVDPSPGSRRPPLKSPTAYG